MSINRRLHNPKYGVVEDEAVYLLAINRIILCEQKFKFSEVVNYFGSKNKHLKNIPEILSQLNLFRDNNGIIRMKSKFRKLENQPILLPKSSNLTKLIVLEAHEKVGHSGIYSVLKQLREQFWIIHGFSTVKKTLKQCIVCRRINAKPGQINQSSYRNFRMSPRQRPFSNVFIDYIGPFDVKLNGEKGKSWLLIITCLWTRGVNLKICRSADVHDFLRAVQLHVFEYGVFDFCISDQGSQIKSGANIISAFVDDYETKSFFESHGINNISFYQYPKGNSSLGSVVESCVKLVKTMIVKSIRKVVLDYFDFEMIINQTVHLVNKRPLAFKEGLRSLNIDETPEPITPEMLLRGYDTCSINIIPSLQGAVEDPSYGEEVVSSRYHKLSIVRSNLLEEYQSQFLSTLLTQATDRKGRYIPKQHIPLKPGDVVMLVEKHFKQYSYDLGRVKSVDVNNLGEVTAAQVFKGKTRETVYRHITSLILLVPSEEVRNEEEDTPQNEFGECSSTSETRDGKGPRPQRRAAAACRTRLAATDY